jgi:hypothetical protein
MPCTLTAYRVTDTTDWTISPAPGKRDWMDASAHKFAYRCLPLVMANQVGWVVGSPINFVANWNGKQDIRAVSVRFPDGLHHANRGISSHFGHGILTISIPWLFRTTPGYGLWVRGPTNMFKENIHPLDGIVETDWAPYTFTMNWKITKRNTDIFFRKGEPVCMLVPVPMGLPEEVEPRFADIDEDQQLKYDFFQFTSRRSGNIIKIAETDQPQWSMDYMKGHLPDGKEVNTHRRAFKLAEFVGGGPNGEPPNPRPGKPI